MALPTPQPVVVDKPRINALIYGAPGTGKTVLAASAADHPDMAPVLIGNFEGGLLSLGNKKNVHQVPMKTIDDVEDLFWCIVNKKEGFDKFKTVVLDSGSEMQTLSLEMLATAAFNKDVEKNRDKAKRESRDQLFQEDYGKDSTRLKRIFRWYRDAPVHTIITALKKSVYSKPPSRDVEPQLIDVVPAFTDKLGQSIMGYMDYVWYTFKDGDTFKLLAAEKGVYRAKTRGMKFAAALGQVVENPNMGALYSKLLETEGNTK